MFSIDLDQIAELSNSHMRAMNHDIAAAYPEHADTAYAVALGFHLCVLLNALDPADRPAAVRSLGSVLSHVGYTITPV